MSPASVPQKTTSMPLSFTPASSRTAASGVPAQAALPMPPVKNGEAVVAGAFHGEGDLLPRPRLDVGERQAQRRVHQPVDFELPGSSRR